MDKGAPSVWFDFDNAPHVAVLLPIVGEMRKRGYRCVLTARDKAETVELLENHAQEFAVIDHGFLASRVLKVGFTLLPAIRLTSHLTRLIH